MTDERDIFNNPYQGTIASIKGRVYRASTTLNDLSVGDLFLIHRPPVGTIIRSISISNTVIGGVEVNLIIGNTSAVTIGSTISTHNGYNLDATKETLSLAPVLRVASITGGVLFPYGFTQTPTATAQRATGSITDTGLRGTYDHDHPAMFKISVTSAGTKLNVIYIWEEI